MEITRRQFNGGAAALAALTALPTPLALSEPGFDDAYARILSELAKVEEAAQASGATNTLAGATTWKGRQLEHFLSHLDMRTDMIQTARQVYGELRDYLDSNANVFETDTDERVQRLAREIRDYAREWTTNGPAEMSETLEVETPAIPEDGDQRDGDDEALPD